MDCVRCAERSPLSTLLVYIFISCFSLLRLIISPSISCFFFLSSDSRNISSLLSSFLLSSYYYRLQFLCALRKTFLFLCASQAHYFTCVIPPPLVFYLTPSITLGIHRHCYYYVVTSIMCCLLVLTRPPLYSPPAFFCHLVPQYFCVLTGMLSICRGVTAFYKSISQLRSSADAVGTDEPSLFFIFRSVTLEFC